MNYPLNISKGMSRQLGFYIGDLKLGDSLETPQGLIEITGIRRKSVRKHDINTRTYHIKYQVIINGILYSDIPSTPEWLKVWYSKTKVQLIFDL